MVLTTDGATITQLTGFPGAEPAELVRPTWR